MSKKRRVVPVRLVLFVWILLVVVLAIIGSVIRAARVMSLALNLRVPLACRRGNRVSLAYVTVRREAARATTWDTTALTTRKATWTTTWDVIALATRKATWTTTWDALALTTRKATWSTWTTRRAAWATREATWTAWTTHRATGFAREATGRTMALNLRVSLGWLRSVEVSLTSATAGDKAALAVACGFVSAVCGAATRDAAGRANETPGNFGTAARGSAGIAARLASPR